MGQKNCISIGKTPGYNMCSRGGRELILSSKRGVGLRGDILIGAEFHPHTKLVEDDIAPRVFARQHFVAEKRFDAFASEQGQVGTVASLLVLRFGGFHQRPNGLRQIHQ